MRWLACFVMVALGCGRIGFDPIVPDDARGRRDARAGGDGAVADPCTGGNCTCNINDCTKECLSGRCSMSCVNGPICNFICNAAPCDVTCSVGSVCIVECGAGNCTVSTDF